MQERVEEISLLRFRGEDPRVGLTAGTGCRSPREDRLILARGVEVAPDGSLQWARDQFRIHGPTGVNVRSLWEFRNESSNQLLAFADDGQMYGLSGLDWVNAVPTQWTYGYELFASATWQALGTVGESGNVHAVADMNGKLYIARSNNYLLQYDGTTLKRAGLLAPTRGPLWDGTVEDVAATWSVEQPTTNPLTVTSDGVSWTNLEDSTTAYVYKDLSYQAIGDFEIRFRFKIVALDTASAVGLVSVSDALGDADDQALGNTHAVRAVRTADGGLYIWIQTSTEGEAQVTSVPIAANTTYYAIFGKEGESLKIDLYSDADFTELVASASFLHTNPARMQYVYAMAADDSPGSKLSSGEVGGIDLTILNPLNVEAGVLPAGKYRYAYTYANDEFESMPSPASPDIVLAAPARKIKIKRIDAPTDPTVTKVRIYRAYGPDASPSGTVGDWQFVHELTYTTPWPGTYEDNISPLALGPGFPYDYALGHRGRELVYHRDRLFMARLTALSESYPGATAANLQNVLTWSAVASPAYWPIENQIRVGDTAPIVALHSWREYLLIFKTNSVWILRGYSEQDFSLEKLSDSGMAAYRAVASSAWGVFWLSHRGIMFFDGGSVRLLVSYTASGLSRPLLDATAGPPCAYHAGRYYFLDDTHLRWWDPELDIWGSDATARSTITCLRAVQLGTRQNHLLLMRSWAQKSPQEITVLHTGRDFPNYAGEGTWWPSTEEKRVSNYFARVDLRLGPLVPGPDEEVNLLEVWIDGSWENPTAELLEGLTPEQQSALCALRLELGTDGQTWQVIGQLPQGFRGYLVPEHSGATSLAGAPLYLRLYAGWAKNFRLYGLRLRILRRQRRAREPVA